MPKWFGVEIKMENKPPFDVFLTSIARATKDIVGDEYPDIDNVMFAEGRDFNIPDHGIDSLDMLDIAFAVDKELGVRINIEEVVMEGKPATLGLLYDHTKPRPER